MQLQENNRLTLGISLCLLGSLLAVSVGGYLLLATSPRDIGPTGVTLWFVAFLIGFTSIITLVRYGFKSRKTQANLKPKLFRHQLRQSFIWGLFLSIALAMQSLRMFNLGDLVLLGLSLGIIELYFKTRKA